MVLKNTLKYFGEILRFINRIFPEHAGCDAHLSAETVDELLPRDLLSAAIRRQMELDHKPYVWLSMEHIPQEEIKSHFPNIYQKCLEDGYDVTSISPVWKAIREICLRSLENPVMRRKGKI